MKTLRIITRLNIGGPARQVALLCHGMAKRGYETVLVFGPIPESEGSMKYLLNLERDDPFVRYVEVPSLQREINLKKDCRAFRSLVKIIKEEKPDIVHTHTAKAGLLGRLALLWVVITGGV